MHNNDCTQFSANCLTTNLKNLGTFVLVMVHRVIYNSTDTVERLFGGQMKRYLLIIMCAISLIGLGSLPISADFILCPGGGAACDGTDFSDVIQGTKDGEVIYAMNGDDLIFGDGGDDNDVFASDGNDVIFGGPGADDIKGGRGNDVLIPGPDGPNEIQFARGGSDNDTINVFVGETSNCLNVVGDSGFDVLNLIGFGPYSAFAPFAEGPIVQESAIILTDPIAGGLIIIDVDSDDIGAIEVVNGLLSPNVVVIDAADLGTILTEQCAGFN
jgi:Ca2+-binding RTX toxin-like protein